MPWLQAHPYLAALAVAIILLVGGVYIVQDRAAVQPQGSQTRAWGGGGYILDSTANTPSYTEGPQKNIYEQVQSGPPFFYYEPPQTVPEDTEGSDEFDFETFLTLLSGPQSANTGVSGESSLEDVYSFIPSGLISTSTYQTTRTPTQQAIYTYGNEAGSYIQSFENTYPDAARILKDQFEDRTNPAKNETLRGLAGALAEVGYTLEALEPPPEVKTAHLKVIESYKELGEKLLLVPNARTDQEMLDAILAYNTAVEAYVKNYVALATLISVYGVTFAPSDSGSVFTFTNASL